MNNRVLLDRPRKSHQSINPNIIKSLLDQSVAALSSSMGSHILPSSSLSPSEHTDYSPVLNTPHWLSEDNRHRLRCGSVCLECLFALPDSSRGQTLSYLVGSASAAFFISALIPRSPFQDSVSLSLPSALIVPSGSQWESIAAVSRFLVCLLH